MEKAMRSIPAPAYSSIICRDIFTVRESISVALV